MCRTLKQLSADLVKAWGHPVLLVETLVDSSRHIGTCYGASSFLRLGQSAGYGTSLRLLRRARTDQGRLRSCPASLQRLSRSSPGPSTIRCCPQTREHVATIDFNTADLSSLIERIATITDPRDPRGVRHDFASTLMLIACATLAGNKSLVAHGVVRQLVPGGPPPPRGSDLPVHRAANSAALRDDPQGGDGGRRG
jgi:hypothetical protein